MVLPSYSDSNFFSKGEVDGGVEVLIQKYLKEIEELR